MADISKIKLANGTIVDLKDAKARSDLSTLLGSHALEALKAAAWLGVDASLTDSGTGVATSGVIKSYVDSQVGAINKFDIQVVASLPTASASTMYILYLVAETDPAKAGTYVEYITVRSGEENNYSYAMERIGTTQADLNDYVKKTLTIAGIDLQDNVTVSELQVALDLGNMAYADTASGSTTLQTVDSITMKAVTVAGNATVTNSEATATISAKSAFTPAGSILVDNKPQEGEGAVQAIKGGSINVTLKDAANKSEADVTRSDYTPAGSVASAISVAGAEETGFTTEGTVSKPAVDLTSTSQAVLTGVKTAGTVPSYEHTGFEGGSFTKGAAVTAAKEGLTAHIAAGDEITGDVTAETLIFAAAATDSVISHTNSSFTAAVYGTDNFQAGAMPTFDDGSVNNVTAAALHEAPTFTGQKLKVTSGFTGTKEENLKVTKVEYQKQDVDEKTFTPVAATISFSGTEVENLIPSQIKYEKANANAAFSETVTPEVNEITKTAKDINITVSPDAKTPAQS